MEHLSLLVGETLGMAVLDSACTKTVAGEAWTNAYLDTLTDKQRQQVKVIPLNVRFRFGDGNDVISNKIVKIPAVLGNQKVFIEASIVANEIPLLMSRSSMKKGQMIINFDDDMAQILGNQVKVNCTSTGHYCIPLTKLLLSDKDSSQSPVVLHTTTTKNATRKELINKAVKLHRQFSHAAKEKLCKLLKQRPDFDNDELLYIVKEQCDLCEACQSSSIHLQDLSVVGLPLADNINKVVCMDLKEYIHNKVWILHVIDAATRYSAACLIRTKHPDKII